MNNELDPDGDLILVLVGHDEGLHTNGLSDETALGENVTMERSVQNEKIRFRVSSKHLCLASPVFRVMLQGKFKEAAVLLSTGTVEIPLEDDNPAAFLILLNIIHGYTRKVPRKITLDLLTQIAILLDKYNCREVVEAFSERWIDQLRGDVPRSLTNTLLLWLCIAWIFEEPAEFRAITQIAERESPGVIEGDQVNSLPIPSSVLNSINAKRQAAISSTLCTLQSFLQKYQGSTILCRKGGTPGFNCDAMVLGGLTKGMASIGLLPPPIPPYEGLSFTKLVGGIRDMQLPALCDSSKHPNGWELYSSPPCGVKHGVQSSINIIEARIRGLSLSDFGRGKDHG
ncbi:hypothetical protein FGG08_004523 [Glutinoglossum americanum]|uniref:BTB domain-containing protein n=1 Tax=Glutinoglossum americanum TaxID=1670608 RepID=A0A9P8I563_9PEZI|nr:hypothetical protein FGG08_004523 [Glutinoglossum americanum]